MANITWDDKATGEYMTAAEMNEVKTAVNSKIESVVDENTFDFIAEGGVGDGTTNNDAVFAAAIASGKERVYFGPGTFKYNSGDTHNIPVGQTWEGVGATSIIKFTGNTLGIRLNTGVTVKGLKFIGAGKAVTAIYNTGLYAYQAATSGWTVRDCIFEDFAGNHLTGSGGGGGGGMMILAVAKNIGNVIINCEFKNNNTGLNIASGEFTQIFSCRFNNNYYGYTDKGGNNFMIGGVVIDNEVGVEIDGTGIANNGHGGLIGVHIAHNTVHNLLMDDLTYGYIINGCQISAGKITISNCTGGVHFNSVQMWSSLDVTLTNNTRIFRVGGNLDFSPTYGKTVVSGHDWELNAYADNTAALAGGLIEGDPYRIGDNMAIVH